MPSGNVRNACDFAIYTFKVYQDLLKSAADHDDMGTFSTVLADFKDQYQQFIADPPKHQARTLRYRLEAEKDDTARGRLDALLSDAEARVSAAEALELAREQIIFALSAYLLDRYINDKDNSNKRALFEAVRSSLPITLERLTEVYDSVGRIDTADQFGWQWWDVKADGKAHLVDTHGKPNQLFCVRAIELLRGMGDGAVRGVHLHGSNDFAYLVNRQNTQGLFATLQGMRQNPNRWVDIIGPDAIPRIDVLERILDDAKAAAERLSADQLVAAQLSPAKVEEFRRSVVGTYRIFGRLRELLNALGAFVDLTDRPAPQDIRSWGYNQLDDKAAFIDDWHVSYPGWGENYGRGLAQTEDHAAYAEMVRAAPQRADVQRIDAIAALGRELESCGFVLPIVLQSFTSLLEYEEILDKDRFVPRYRDDCPTTPVSEVDGFMGVLKSGRTAVPILNLRMNDINSHNRVLVFDGNKFAKLVRFSPADEVTEQSSVLDGIYIKVTDLNADDTRRNEIMESAPDWLRNEREPERYLRMRVVVNVYERFSVDVLDPASAFAFTVIGKSVE